MPHALKFTILASLLALISACARPEPLRTVSDFCLNDRRISIEPAPAAGTDDPGNSFDSDPTVNEALEHNAVYDSLCPVRGPVS